ncbi:MAG: peptidylprolyl isomerase [Alistipes sp.]|jgi:peptidyl-prolyl cis-trans isomerase SurA|nr:peptidylprolyl isomerase [Alistipes sp.]
MTRKIIILFAAAFATAFAAQTASGQQKFVADKVVAVVGNFPILYSEVVEQSRAITEQYRQQNYTSPRPAMSEALEALLEQKMLYNRAQIDSVGIIGHEAQVVSMADGSVEDMIAEAGSITALEALEHNPLYTIKENMRRDYEEYVAANAMRDHINGQVKVTPGEVERFYRRVDKDSLPTIPEQYVYAQITRLPKSSELAKQRARERLLGLRQRVIDGERFDRLAVMYSIDPGSAMRGGEMGPAPKETFVEPFANALAKLQPGQVSGVVETEYGFHIIQLLDKPAENSYHLRHILIKPTYTVEEQAETLDFLDSLAGVVRAGGITFEEAAARHSDDKATRMNGGVVTNQDILYRGYQITDPSQTRYRHVRDNIEQNDAQQLIRLKEGEMTKPFIGRDFQMNEMGKMLRLVEIVPAHKADLNEDYLDIENMALTRKQRAHYMGWLNSKIDETYIRIDPMFRPDDFVNKRWFK